MSDGEQPLIGTRIGFIGAGRIGSPMAQRLAAAGAEVTVFSRRPEVRDELTAHGCRAVTTMSGLGTDNSLVFSCLFSDAQLESVVDELIETLAPGSVIASHTTGSPVLIRALGERLADRQVEVVDAPFSGTPEHIRAGTLTVLAGGSTAALDRVEPALRSYAGVVIRTGGLGTALVLKLLNNVVFAANVQLSLEVSRLAEAAGLPMSIVLDVLENSSGGTRAMRYLGDFESAEAYARQTRPFLAKDVAVCEEVAASMGLDLGLLARVIREGSLDVSGD